MIGTVAGAVQRTLTVHWKALLPVALALGVVSTVVGNILGSITEDSAADIEAGQSVDFGGLLSAILVGSLLVIMISLILDAIIFNMIDEGERTGTADIGYGFRRTFERIGPLAVLVIVSGIVVAFGFLLFILPGIFLVVVLFPSIGVLFMEDKGAIASMARSRELVQPRFFEVFGLLIVLVIFSIVVSFVLALFGFVGAIVSSALLAIVGQATVYHGYMELSGRTS